MMSGTNIVTMSWWEEYSATVSAGSTHRAELFVRSLAPGPGGHRRSKQVLEGLDRASENGILNGYDITVLGTELCLCETCVDAGMRTQLLQKVGRLQEWDSEHVESVGLTERTVDSSITGEHYHSLTPPEQCLAVFVDDSIEGVFPCSIDGDCVTPMEYLHALNTADSVPARSLADA